MLVSPFLTKKRIRTFEIEFSSAFLNIESKIYFSLVNLKKTFFLSLRWLRCWSKFHKFRLFVEKSPYVLDHHVLQFYEVSVTRNPQKEFQTRWRGSEGNISLNFFFRSIFFWYAMNWSVLKNRSKRRRWKGSSVLKYLACVLLLQ